MPDVEARFALLIDADNVSSKYIKPILDELSKYGNITYKRIYADWTRTQSSSWKEVLLQNSLAPIQQFNYTTGKNSTDSAMIIDAMDMLYSQNLEGFCLVSSDSDFTKLASRLREGGMKVIGMGERKTPPAFRQACDVFTELDLLLDDSTIGNSVKGDKNESQLSDQGDMEPDNEEKGVKSSDENEVTRSQIEEAVVQIIIENQNNGKDTGLGEIGSRLVKMYPDFDVRRYGYSLLSKFLETFPKLTLHQEGTQVMVRLNEDRGEQDKLEEFIVDQVRQAGEQGMSLSTLGSKIHSSYPDFKVRDYGYSQFNKYIQNIDHIEVVTDGDQNLARYKE